MKRVLIILATIALLSSCGMTTGLTRGTQYPLMYKEKPVTLLVMPPINNTTNVEAKDLLYTSISKPLIDAGYYVIPPMITMEVLKEESAYDSEIFVDSSLDMFKTFFWGGRSGVLGDQQVGESRGRHRCRYPIFHPLGDNRGDTFR